MPEPLTDPELFELALTVFAGADPRQAHGYAKVNTLFLQDKADDLPFLGRGNLARLGRMALFRAFDAGELVFNDLVACICGRLSFPDLVTFATGAVQDVYPERIPGYIAVEALFTRDFDTRLADPTKAALIQVVATRAQTEERANATDIAQRLEQLWAEARDREAAVLQCNAAGEESSVPRGGVVKQLATACRKLSLAELTSLAIGVYSERNPQELPGYETIQPFCLEGEGRCRFRPDLRKPLIHWALRRTAAAEKDTLMEGLNDPYGSLKEVHHMKLVQALLPMPFAELLPFVIAVLQDTEVLEIPGYRQAEVLFAANNGHDLLEATRMCLPAILSQRATDEGLVDYHPFYLNKKLEWYQAHRQFVRQVVGEIMEEEAGQAAVTAPDLNGNGATSPNGLMDRRQRRALAKQQRKLERKQSKSARRTDEDEALDFNLLAEDFDDAATTAASRRRGKRKNSDDARLSWAGAQYSQKIIKCLQQIGAYSGHRPYVIFNDWIRLVEAALQALPAL
ncbi:MAG: hypothetical protein BroJett011_43110 [Chloroflexota bacterium]|nr:MAG: hypothetical protein BroJett011_43110 [Chloroflexota bacterium]